MKELNIAGNKVLSYKIDQDDLLPFKLKIHGYEKFDDLLGQDVNYFRTPIDVDNKETGPGYQYELYDATVQASFSDFVTNIINTHLGSDMGVKDIWYLYQPNESWIDNPPHRHLTAEWVAVLYLDVRDGDSIQFFDASGTMGEYFPVFGEILFFPATAEHKPGVSVGNKRLTINAELSRNNIPQDELDMAKNRLSTCNSCDNYNTDTQLCSECHCYIPQKITIMDSTCPILKW